MFTITLKNIGLVLNFEDEQSVQNGFLNLQSIRDNTLDDIKYHFIDILKQGNIFNDKFTASDIVEVDFNGYTTNPIVKIRFNDISYINNQETLDLIEKLSNSSEFEYNITSTCANWLLTKIKNYTADTVNCVDKIVNGKYPSVCEEIIILNKTNVVNIIKNTINCTKL